MARIFNVEVNGQPIAEIGTAFKDALRKFYLDLGCPKADKVIPHNADIPKIIELALGEFTYMTAAKKTNRGQLTSMLEAACKSLN